MSDDLDWRILDRYLAGGATAADEAAVRVWLAADARNAALVERLHAASHSPAQWNADAAWTTLAGRLTTASDRGRIARGLSVGSAPSRRRRVASIAGAAAAIAAAAIFAVSGDVVAPSAPATTGASASVHVASAPIGGQRTVTLPDGTRVRLNAGSTLTRGDDYGRASRDVELDGEGYFDVVHDAARPFRVRTRGGVAEDLGTRFVVRAYPEMARLEVAVAEGRVALRRRVAASDSALLGPGQLGTLAADGALRVESGVDLERWLGWTHGALVLDGMTFADAATAIGRRFDVDVTVHDDQLRARVVSARFTDQPLAAVLDALSVALDATWSRDGRTVTLSPAE